MRRIVACAAVCACVFVPAAGAAGTETGGAQTSCAQPASTVKKWVAAWRVKKWKQMVRLSEVSWRRRTFNAAGTLRDQYGFKDVLTYRFTRCRASSVSGRVTFAVEYRDFKVRRVRITAMVIRENASGAPSSSGRWGVNPISTLRESPF